MNSYQKKLTNFKEYFVLLGCLLFSLLLIFSNRNEQLDAVKTFAIDLIGSVQARVAYFSKYAFLEQENKFLRHQNTVLALENSRMRAALQENIRLRRLIGFKEQSDYELVAAKVIGRNSSGFMNQILLDVGEKDSINKNMPIVLPDGLVGKIYRVEENFSIGHLILDQNFRVSAKVQRSSINGIIGWESERSCSFNEIPNRSDVQAGDLVVTSGYSDIFPEGIYIGKITDARDTQRDLFMNVTVKPDIDFNRLEEVLIITKYNNKDS
ncbi:rod shape-determining protein MreC [candidate division KSB1 bacterium]|nr:rod shape-determining protein MreC [candidate division KSB1 bacterium]